MLVNMYIVNKDGTHEYVGHTSVEKEPIIRYDGQYTTTELGDCCFIFDYVRLEYRQPVTFGHYQIDMYIYP